VILEAEDFSSAKPGLAGNMKKENTAKTTNTLDTTLIKSCMIFISKKLLDYFNFLNESQDKTICNLL
jgi:hypothetical protein